MYVTRCNYYTNITYSRGICMENRYVFFFIHLSYVYLFILCCFQQTT